MILYVSTHMHGCHIFWSPIDIGRIYDKEREQRSQSTGESSCSDGLGKIRLKACAGNRCHYLKPGTPTLFMSPYPSLD